MNTIDIWHHQQGAGFGGGRSGSTGAAAANSSNKSRGKRSRSVLAMPNQAGELSSSSRGSSASGTHHEGGGGWVSRASQFDASATTAKQIEDNPMSSEHSAGSREELAGAAAVGGAGQAASGQLAGAGKQHAGPMGIFFKVWSLVKVTKGRHQRRQQQQQRGQLNHPTDGQHRLRRQNSEDISSYGVADGRLLRHRSSNIAAAQLQDSHFRRAGSQPAASSAALLDRLQVAPGASSSSTSSGLQTSTTTIAAPPTATTAATATTTTTSSSCTSSGVSSTTSSTLAANSSNSPTTSSSSSPFRRRQPQPAAAAAGNSRLALTKPQEQQKTQSWVTRMRRSAASRSAGGGGAREPTSRQPHLLSLSLSTSDGSRSSSEPCEEYDVIDDGAADEDYDEGDEGGVEEEDEDDEAEKESNDIYSTPNDSIQSVPSGQRALAHLPQAAGQQQPYSHPIIKSFSTNNFQQAVAQAAQAQAHESQLADQLDRRPERKNSNDSGSGSDSRQQHRLGGSRFLISSSSSEDSQAAARLQLAKKPLQESEKPQQQQQQRQMNGAPLAEEQQNCAQQPQPQPQVRPRVSVNQGVHCHAASGAPMRPRSLLLAPAGLHQEQPSLMNQFLVPMQMLTPVAGVASPSATAATVYLGPAACLRAPAAAGGYQRSPSLFEFPFASTRFSSKYPPQVSSFQQHQQQQQPAPRWLRNAPPAPSGGQNLNQSRQSFDSNGAKSRSSSIMMPSSISMYDFKQTAAASGASVGAADLEQRQQVNDEPIEEGSEYKLAEMMLESGSNPNAKDALGNTTLMLAILSDNLPAVKCLLEHGADLNETNSAGLAALDLVCARQATQTRLEILKTLIDNRADLDRQRHSDGSRLLDRLIKEHQPAQLGSLALAWCCAEKMPYIECLLESGAKLSSSTWRAAQGKLEIQLSLLRKLCQDGYFLYKQGSIEASVYRFEYALKRIAELEQQLSVALANHGGGVQGGRRKQSALMAARFVAGVSPEYASMASKKIKYQTYLGLSRCERRRKFYKRALEFAQLAILVDSTAYEGFYSKAHILKDMGEFNDSLLTIDQTSRLLEKTIENSSLELKFLEQQEETLIMDTCFDLDMDACRNQRLALARNKVEVQGNVEYLLEARKYVAKLRQDILEDKFNSQPRTERILSQTSVGEHDEMRNKQNGTILSN